MGTRVSWHWLALVLALSWAGIGFHILGLVLAGNTSTAVTTAQQFAGLHILALLVTGASFFIEQYRARSGESAL